jgi:hypothetical protein
MASASVPARASTGSTLHWALNSISSMAMRADGSSSATTSRPARIISGSAVRRRAAASGRRSAASFSTGKAATSTIG